MILAYFEFSTIFIHVSFNLFGGGGGGGGGGGWRERLWYLSYYFYNDIQQHKRKEDLVFVLS